MTTTQQYNWLRKLPKDVKNLSETPLFGISSPLDNSQFEQLIEKTLGLKGFQLETTAIEFKELDGKSDVTLIEIKPLKESVFLEIPKEGLDRLISQLFGKASQDYLIDESLRAGFKNFVFMEALNAFQKASHMKQLSPIYTGKEETVKEGPLWVSSFTLNWEDGGLTGRILFSDTFRQAFKKLFQESGLIPSKKIAASLYLDVHVEVGKAQLSREAFKSLNPGDYLILDSCQLEPGENKGRAILTVNGEPAFRAKFKNGTLKILETPQFNELGTQMSTPPDDEDLEDSFDEEETEEEEEYFDEDEEGAISDETEEEEEPEAQETRAVSAKQVQQKPFKADEIPLNITVEAGRFQMTVEKLSSLEPGNVIDLNVNPEEGVDLVVNGHTVAKGELLKVGETLGVRILDIAK
ncbi:MAG: type III secretion system cytoplasmic ring protein SctQ [Chlamydiia bacterium]|nr:type III secretion system cytoplasmic ring protein SctQ [Chlamydiia bacterium]